MFGLLEFYFMTMTFLFWCAAVVFFVVVLDVKSDIFECSTHCSCLKGAIDCSKKSLLEVPPDIPLWAETLDLSFNRLTENVTYALKRLEHLTKLKLNRNLLSSIPVVSSSSDIIHLSLSHNSISFITASVLEKYPKLRFLDISNNQIIFINARSFPVNCSIQNLNLNYNQISSIEPASLDNLQNLTELKLSRNQIPSFNKDHFKYLKNLKVLEINRNQLVEIDGLTFRGLQSLEVLKLKRNIIMSLLDGAFWGLHNISALHLDHNNITSIKRGWLYGLITIKNLFLNNNHISVIEDNSWEFCQHLDELDMSNNDLRYITKRTFFHLTKLRKLYLNNNKILYIDDAAFKNIPHLEVLELDSNKISWTIENANGVFIALKKLTKFSLASNNIKSINKNAFIGLRNVIVLNLSNNDIASVEENPFEPMQDLQVLHINSSSLLCDCHLKWLSSWLQNTSFYKNIQMVCSYPYSVSSMSVINVTFDNFKCDDFPKPHILEHPESRIAMKGSNVSLNCKAMSSSNVPMFFNWKKDNFDFNNGYAQQYACSPNGITVEKKSELFLLNVSDNDSGNYQCVVSNSFGITYTQKALLSVLVYPLFTKVPQNITILSGETARLECASVGQPAPQISWQKDGGTDFPAARERRMHVMTSDDVFFILNVKPVDMGVYSCIARNVAGIAVVHASLTVLESPVFVKPMENKEVAAGETVVLECMASGSPKPYLTWTKDGSPLVTTKRHFFTADDQLLVIVGSEPSDAGTYECIMSNNLGEKRGSSHLSVIPASTSSVNEFTVTGVMVITIVCCAVGTSVIWVIIIYQTRKRTNNAEVRSDCQNYPNTLIQETEITDVTLRIYLDTGSEDSTSKDSGTGDSSKHSSNDLLENEGSLNVEKGDDCKYEDSKHILARKNLVGKDSLKSSLALKNFHYSNHDRCCLEDKCNTFSHRWSAPQCVSTKLPITYSCSYASLPTATSNEASSQDRCREGADSSDETTFCILEN